MSSSLHLPAEASLAHLPGELVLERGGAVGSVVIGYRSYGPADGPVLIVQGGISAGRDVCAELPEDPPGWWDGFVGPLAPIDTQRFRVLALDYLGGNGLTTGPRNVAQRGHEGLAFPAVSSADQAELTSRLLDLLGIEHVHAFVGASYGAMVALAFAAAHGDRLGRWIAISGAHRAHPMATAWRSLQRRIVQLGLAHGCADDALNIARGLGMASYRSAEEFGERFAGDPTRDEAGTVFPVESYLEARGAHFVDRFHAEALFVLSRAIDLHHVDPRRIRTPGVLVASRSDHLVPESQLRELAGLLDPEPRFVRLDSKFGHDAFLKEREQLGAVLRESLGGAQR